MIASPFGLVGSLPQKTAFSIAAIRTTASRASTLVIESLGQAIRSAAFFVPGAIGVQEGGFMAVGILFGIGPEVGLAVSLIKRIREVGLGVPALVAWKALEGRRLIGGFDGKAGQ